MIGIGIPVIGFTVIKPVWTSSLRMVSTIIPTLYHNEARVAGKEEVTSGSRVRQGCRVVQPLRIGRYNTSGTGCNGASFRPLNLPQWQVLLGEKLQCNGELGRQGGNGDREKPNKDFGQ
jgi:hypothetical protein